MYWHPSEIVSLYVTSQEDPAVSITIRDLVEYSMNRIHELYGLRCQESILVIITTTTFSIVARSDSKVSANWTSFCRGYVALAVATEKETSTKEAETGLGGDREGNMVAFALEGLKLLRDVIKGTAKL